MGRTITEQQMANMDEDRRKLRSSSKKPNPRDVLDDDDLADSDDPDQWKTDLLERLLLMSPDAFERWRSILGSSTNSEREAKSMGSETAYGCIPPRCRFQEPRLCGVCHRLSVLLGDFRDL